MKTLFTEDERRSLREVIRAALQEEAGPACPLLTRAYGGIHTAGGFQGYTMGILAAAHIAEAAHCILGVASTATHGAVGKPAEYRVEPHHVLDELKVIERWMDRGGVPDEMNNPRDEESAEFVRDGIAHVQRQAPKLKKRAAQMLSDLKRQKDVPSDVMELATACYNVLMTLADALLKAVTSKPIRDFTEDAHLVRAVTKLKRAARGL